MTRFDELRAAIADRLGDAGRSGRDTHDWEHGCPGCDGPIILWRDNPSVSCERRRCTGDQADALLSPRRAVEHAEGPLQFVTARELRASTPEEPEWVWRGYLARNAVTLLAGKPKAGKSTLALAVAEAIVSRAPSFLGRAVTGGPVVYVSEEGAATLRSKVGDSEQLVLLDRERAWPPPSWPSLIDEVVAEAHRIGASLIVVDTFARWAGLTGDAEHSAGHVQAAMEPLLGAARTGLAVLLVHHQRKAGGEGGDAIRGSTALPAAVDVVMEYERPARPASRRHRQVTTTGRWSVAPPVLLVDVDEHGAWREIGEGIDPAGASAVDWTAKLLEVLPSDGPGVTHNEIEQATDTDKRKWHSALHDLVVDGSVIRAGEGKKNAPYVYRRAPAHDAVPGFRPDPGTETDGKCISTIPSLPSHPYKGGAEGIAQHPIPSLPSRPVDPDPFVQTIFDAFPGTVEIGAQA